MTDYYKILGLDKNASQHEIKKAYRKLSMKFHPDMNNGDEFFENMFKQLQQAYEVLGNESSRKAYDLSQQNSKTTYRNQQEQSYTNTKSSYKENMMPVIEYFAADKSIYYKDMEIRLRWNVQYADWVVIDLLGEVPSRGTKTVRLKNIPEGQYFSIKLKATNTYNSKSTSAEIVFEHVNARNERKKHQAFYTKSGKYKDNFWSSKGRIRRSTYVLRLLIMIIPYTLFAFLYEENEISETLFSLISFILFIAIAIQAIKRLHDINKSGWYYLLFFVPIANLVLGLYLLFVDGTIGINNYAPSPKQNQ